MKCRGTSIYFSRRGNRASDINCYKIVIKKIDNYLIVQTEISLFYLLCGIVRLSQTQINGSVTKLKSLVIFGRTEYHRRLNGYVNIKGLKRKIQCKSGKRGCINSSLLPFYHAVWARSRIRRLQRNIKSVRYAVNLLECHC